MKDFIAVLNLQEVIFWIEPPADVEEEESFDVVIPGPIDPPRHLISKTVSWWVDYCKKDKDLEDADE